MSQITDLTGTTWEFKDTINLLEDGNFNINFSTLGDEHPRTMLQMWTRDGEFGELIYSPFNVVAYRPESGNWESAGYKTISITGGTDATNPDLISWLQSNATQIIEPQEDPKISIGASPLVSASVGNADVQSIWVGNVKVWENVPDYDYAVSDGVITLNNAPYEVSEGVITIL